VAALPLPNLMELARLGNGSKPRTCAAGESCQINPMPRDRVAAVIGKAILRAEFRQALFDNFDAALAGFDLSEAERAHLRRVDREMLDMLGSILDAPISKSPLFAAAKSNPAPRGPA
jgi:hypothetical protein